ncbi:hypothetical protein EDC28_109135 [Gallaecimonas pentaromativorans]|uniref:Uncharacterized protein n=1 Tax=Gallaecimonas pentaromativorans TaxID=584787 RepID=A0A3N1PDK8_9GAMM|nr:hypothetical protein EDC28_109135 [Gallaecimonas pentaromativorans]
MIVYKLENSSEKYVFFNFYWPGLSMLRGWLSCHLGALRVASLTSYPLPFL